MKRIKILMLLIVPVLLTGCADTLKCEIETNNYNSTIKIKYEEDKPVSYNFKDEMLFSKDSTDSELYYHSKYTEYDHLIMNKYATMRNTGTTVSTKINYDFAKNDKETENKLLITKTDTKKQATKKIKSLGYTCK